MAENLVVMAYSLVGNTNIPQKTEGGKKIKGVDNILKAAKKESVVFSVPACQAT